MSTVVLDSGAVTRLASRDRRTAARIGSLKQRGIWPPVVPSVVLAECLTGRQSTDAVTNRFLKSCKIEEQLPEQVPASARAKQRELRVTTVVLPPITADTSSSWVASHSRSVGLVSLVCHAA